MPENKVFMDTNVVTDIVNEIKYTSSDLVLSQEPLSSVKVWDHTDVGKKMEKILKKVYKASSAYRSESAEALPEAFLKMRDSMIRVDDVASKSLKVNE